MSQFEGNKKEYDSNIVQDFISKTNLGVLIPKLNSH